MTCSVFNAADSGFGKPGQNVLHSKTSLERPTQLGKLFLVINYILKQLSKIPTNLVKLFLGIY